MPDDDFGKHDEVGRAPETRLPNRALGVSEAFLDFQERLSQVARVNRPVLLIGERGAGKELAAQQLHSLSERWSGPLVSLNCAALSPTLIESELFGHEAGAFTGAARKRAGRFEMADGGTLFLDEIGNIPMVAQEKILRAVEYGTFERVGGTESVEVDARILGAANVDLVALSDRGEFKRDLLDRLSFEVLFLPPLRERVEDIPLLAGHFATQMAFELGREEVPEFGSEAMESLENYDWPGNIRELKNVVERAVYRADTDTIRDIRFDPFLPEYELRPPSRPNPPPAEKSPEPEKAPPEKAERTYADSIRELEIDLLQTALEGSRHNQKKAAQSLGMTYHQFRWLYQKHRDSLRE